MKKIKTIPKFLIVPYELIINNNIAPLDLKVYGIINWFVSTTKRKKCFTKNNTIALLLSSDKRPIGSNSVQVSLTNLEKQGYIKKIYTNKQKNKRIEIIPLIKNNALLNQRATSSLPLQIKGRALSNQRAIALLNKRGYISKKYKSIKDIDIKTPTPDFLEKTSLKILKWYHYTISKKTTSEKIVITKKVREVISEALQEFTPLNLLLAVKGFSEDKWQMDKNGFRGAEWFFSDSKRLGQYIGLFNQNRQENFIKKAEKFLND